MSYTRYCAIFIACSTGETARIFWKYFSNNESTNFLCKASEQYYYLKWACIEQTHKALTTLGDVSLRFSTLLSLILVSSVLSILAAFVCSSCYQHCLQQLVPSVLVLQHAQRKWGTGVSSVWKTLENVFLITWSTDFLPEELKIWFGEI